MSWHLTLYSKLTCPLCDEAKRALREFAKECEFELDVVDISNNPALWEQYRFEIPVLLIEGQEATRHYLGMKKLRQLRHCWDNGQGVPKSRSCVFPAS